jgi:predicted ATPase
MTAFFLGKPVEARMHLEQSLEIYAVQQRDTLPAFYDYDVGPMCLSYATMSLLAHDRTHPQLLAHSLCVSAMLCQFLRNNHLTREGAEATIRFSSEHEFTFWRAYGVGLRGKALAELGQKEEGMEQLQQGMSQLRAIGVETARPYYLSLLAEEYGSARQPEAGLRELREALALVEKTGERLWEAELWRLTGELTLQAGVQRSYGRR